MKTLHLMMTLQYGIKPQNLHIKKGEIYCI